VATEKKHPLASEPHLPSRGEYVYNELLKAILDGHYVPGRPIREVEVAERLNVSRTPVREAFRRLQTDGILVFTPWRGVIVAELDEQQIIELYAMRKVLEGTAAAMAAQYATDQQIADIERIIEQAEGESDVQALADLNRDFHQAIFDAANNRYLVHAMQSLRTPMALLSKTTYAVTDRPLTAQTEHRHILDAIRQRDTRAADKLGYGHIANAETARFELLKNS